MNRYDYPNINYRDRTNEIYGKALATPLYVDTRYEDNVELIKTLYKQVLESGGILENESK